MQNLFKRILSSVILLPLSFYLIISGSYFLLSFILICLLISSYEWHMMTKKKKNYKIFGIFFLFFSFYTFYQLSYELYLVFFIVLICISTDIGGYILGKVFKGPKLTKISPKKTYAGMIGSYLFSIICLIIFSYLFDYSQIDIKIFLFTIIISTLSQIGDLIISYFKRLSNIKDTGKIIPGHGGLLDRIDGMIFTFPIIYLIKLLGFLNI
jgi:phosphatidate cytidylyltransferase